METNKLVMTDNFIPTEATSPWEIVVDEYKARGIKQAQLAEMMGIQPSNLNRCIKNKAEITPYMADCLEKALGIPAKEWLAFQRGYEEDLENIAKRNIRNEEAERLENILQPLLNLKELYKALKIKPYHYVCERIEELEGKFHIPVNEIVECCGVGAFKKSEKSKTDERNQNTWVLLAYYSAMNNKPVNEYVKGNAEMAAREIAEKANAGTLKEANIKAVLSDYGISYSVVKKLEKTPIDAYSMWALEYPSITVTHRYNDMSRLVFNVLHELKHIESHLEKGSKRSFISSEDSYNSTSKEELEANKFAEDMLIPPAVWSDIINGQAQLSKIVQYLKKKAKEKNLSKDIVVWRFKYSTGFYNLGGVKTTSIS